jgi:ankyrin repeat protein
MGHLLPRSSELAQALLREGFAPEENFINKNGALIWVARHNLPQLTRQLISEGADVNAKVGSLDGTALFYAARANRCNVMRILLDSNASVSIQRQLG